MWKVYGIDIESRLMLGSASYPSPKILSRVIETSKTNIVTTSLSRQMPSTKGGEGFWSIIKNSKCHILPNTAGCRIVKDAITMAQMSREIFATNWIKLELIGDDYTLQPDSVLLLEATKELVKEGFEVFPYCTDDLIVCQKLVDHGCKVLMPGLSPIGSGQGILNIYNLRLLRNRFKDIRIIADAGIGKPSDATAVMEIGFDAILINSAIARAEDPVNMALAFKNAITAGHLAHNAGIIPKRDFAVPSTPLIDTPFWHTQQK